MVFQTAVTPRYNGPKSIRKSTNNGYEISHSFRSALAALELKQLFDLFLAFSVITGDFENGTRPDTRPIKLGRGSMWGEGGEIDISIKTLGSILF